MAKYSEEGLPIVTLGRKLEYLACCFGEGSYEDAAGHLCDLLEYCRKKIKPDTRDVFRSIEDMVRHYGHNSTSIEE